METTLLLPAELEVLDTCLCQDAVTIHLTLASPVGHCPLCQLHSRYRRTLADLPLGGKRVCLQLYSLNLLPLTGGFLMGRINETFTFDAYGKKTV